MSELSEMKGRLAASKRRYRLEAARLALYVRPDPRLDQDQKSGGAGRTPARRRGLERTFWLAVESPQEVAGAMDRTEEQRELASLLNAATTFDGADLARQQDWITQVEKLLLGRRRATLDEQRTDLVADMRELLRYALSDPTIVETQWFWRRAHRALCQDDGTVGPGEDFVRQYRSKTPEGWSKWNTMPGDRRWQVPEQHGEVRFAAAGKPFDGW